jgi:hypothetical protein
MTRPATLHRTARFVALAAALLSAGCGQLSIKTWVNVDPAESGGSVTLIGAGTETPILNLQGGFLASFQVDTRDLPGALVGTAEIEDVRIAGNNQGLAGRVCTWNDSAGSSGGTISLDLLSGVSTADLTMDLLAQSDISKFFGLPPVELDQEISLDLGGGLGLSEFLAILNTGTMEGALATVSELVTETTIAGLPVEVALTLAVENGPLPPAFHPFYVNGCQTEFDLQGTELFHGINTKSSYLLADDGDVPLDPIVIDLAVLDVLPGDTLRLTREGTFATSLLLRDGNETGMTGVFSATDTILTDDLRYRIPDAIDAGTDFVTAGYWTCVLIIFCTVEDTDIDEDFEIDPTVDVVVPAGANYLIVAPYDDADQKWDDNGGLAFGVGIDVI